METIFSMLEGVGEPAPSSTNGARLMLRPANSAQQTSEIDRRVVLAPRMIFINPDCSSRTVFPQKSLALSVYPIAPVHVTGVGLSTMAHA